MNNHLNPIQNLLKIEDDFSFLENWEERYRHIIDYSKTLTPVTEEEKNDTTKVSGCVSQVWLVEEFKNGRIYFRGFSDSVLVMGLLAILVEIYSGATPIEILNLTPEEIFTRLNLIEALTPNRAGGLRAMAKRMIDFAASKI